MLLSGFHAIRGNLASGCLLSLSLFERLGRGFNFIGLLQKLINKNGNIYVEYRTDKDKDNKKTFNNHYRNFINPKNLENILNKLNLKSIYFKEGRGMAKFKKEDAYVARNIIQLK